MISVEKEIRKETELEEQALRKIYEIVKNYKIQSKLHLETICAELCGVDVLEMMEDTKLHNSQARWFYWYAYWYMTKENYTVIAQNRGYKRKFTAPCVCVSISKMADFISANTIWTKRWTIVKAVIKGILSSKPKQQELFEDEIHVKVTTPSGVIVEHIKQ